MKCSHIISNIALCVHTLALHNAIKYAHDAQYLTYFVVKVVMCLADPLM